MVTGALHIYMIIIMMSLVDYFVFFDQGEPILLNAHREQRLNAREPILCSDIAPDYKTIATLDSKQHLVIWDAADATQIKDILVTPPLRHRPRLLRYSPATKRIIVADLFSVVLVDYATDRCDTIVNLNFDSMLSTCALTRDGSKIVYTFFDGRDPNGRCMIGLLDTRNNDRRVMELNNIKGANCVLTSENAKNVVITSNEGDLLLVDMELLRPIRRFIGHRAEVCSMVLFCNEGYVMSYGFDDALMVWELSTGRSRRIAREREGPIREMRISADDKRILLKHASREGGIEEIPVKDAKP